MQFAAKEPIHRCLPPSGQVGKDPMLANPTIVADFEAGGIYETDACASAKTVFQVGTQEEQSRGYPFDKASITDQTRKGFAPVCLDFLGVLGFEVTVVRLMEGNQNRHDFAECQAAISLTATQPMARQLLVPLGLKALAKVINVAKQVFYTQHRTSQAMYDNTFSLSTRPFLIPN